MVQIASLLDRLAGVKAPAGADELEIRQRQIATLLRQAPLALAVGMTGSLMACFVHYAGDEPAYAGVWAGLVWAFSLALLRLSTRCRSSAHIGRRIVALAAAHGLVWSVGLAVLMAFSSIEQRLILLLILAGIASAGASALAPLPFAAIAGLLSVTAPVVIWLAMQGDVLQSSVAGLVVITGLIGLYHARSVYGTFIETVRTKIANSNLLRELKLTRASLLDAIANTSEAFALFDENDRLVICNENFGEFLLLPRAALVKGARFEDLLRQSAPPVAGAADKPAPKDWFEKGVARHRTAAGSYVQRLANGRWLHTSDRRTARGGTVTVHVDITAVKENEIALARAKEEAEAANRAKSDFLAMMSHELRTPLNAIMGFSEILANEAYGPHADPRYRDYGHDIHKSGTHLLQVINDILDLSKIEAGKLDLQEEQIDVAEVADDVTRMLVAQAADAGLTLVNAVPAGMPPLFADRRAVKQMLVNLLTNAIKFTPTGGCVTVAAVEGPAGLELSVEDTGIGIAKADLPKMLEPFGQIDSGLSRAQEGTGLGIPLVRSLIELHDGVLKIESAVAVGTRVTLVFGRERLASRHAA